ncbi:hypothetical protein C5167_046322 [Papaver somniferum]|uniref:Uncharacterized protein n=1 Tax=Papaver somniferum TaxID=3469 RepID=A0A4Y7LDG4_PAPSO|nr:hypothetical protein C5167_046322 [Papaver somniferum]
MGTKRGKVETALEDFDNMPGRNSVSLNWSMLSSAPNRASGHLVLTIPGMKEITVSRSKVPSVLSDILSAEFGVALAV